MSGGEPSIDPAGGCPDRGGESVGPFVEDLDVAYHALVQGLSAFQPPRALEASS
jgi:hypothetical protein